MNKKKIIIASLVVVGLVFLILDFLSYKVNKIVKDLLINKGKEVLCQQVSVGNIDTSILGSSIKISNIEIRNLEGFKNKNIIQIKNINTDFDLKSVFTNNIIINSVNIEGANLYYELILDKKDIKDNVSAFKACQKADDKKINDKKVEDAKTDVKAQSKSDLISKKDNKNFIVKQLILNNISLKVSSEFLDISKDINLNKMSFKNVGNVETANKFKDVLKMIFENVLLSINNEIIQGDLKDKIKNKLKNLRTKISPESFKKLEKNFR
jgi:hypothetical protein